MLYNDSPQQVYFPESPKAVRQVAAHFHTSGLFRGKKGLVQGAVHGDSGKGMDGITSARKAAPKAGR